MPVSGFYMLVVIKLDIFLISAVERLEHTMHVCTEFSICGFIG